MKWSGSAEGPGANAADLIALQLARAIGISVPTPRLLHLADAVIDQKQDPELNDLVRRSLGTNLGIDEVPAFEAYEPRHRDLVPAPLRATVYALDLLLLNMDRIAGNPNMVMTADGLLCWDYAAAMEVRMLLNGRPIDEKRFYPLLRQHPFFDPGPPPGNSWPSVGNDAIMAILTEVPPEWLPNAIDLSACAGRLAALFRDAESTIARRHAGVSAVSVESDAERSSRTNANRRAFEEAVQRPATKKRPSGA
jgi:hypothetical protein